MFERLRRKVADFSGKAKVKAEQIEQRVELERGKVDARQLRRMKKKREKVEARAVRERLKTKELQRIEKAEVELEEPSRIRRARQVRRVKRRTTRTRHREGMARARQRATPSGFSPGFRAPPTRPSSRQRPVRSKPKKKTKWF